MSDQKKVDTATTAQPVEQVKRFPIKPMPPDHPLFTRGYIVGGHHPAPKKPTCGGRS